jgi:hypothetical protein
VDRDGAAAAAAVRDLIVLPGKYDLTLYRGDSGAWRFVLWDDAAHTDPFDLTGATVKSEIRDKPGGVVIADLDCAVTLPNIVAVTLPAADSASIPVRGVWDLQVTFADATVRTMVAGAVTSTADVTDSIAAVAAVEDPRRFWSSA